MGHALAYEEVSLEEIPEDETRPIRSSYYGYRSQNLESRVLTAGISKWRSEEAGRWDDENPGTAVMLSPVPGPLVNKAIENHYDTSKHGYGGTSPVVPIIDPKDYEIKTKTVTIKLVGEEWEDYLKTGLYYSPVQDKLKDQLFDIYEDITGLEIVREGGNKYFSEPTEGWTVRSSIDADTSGGKAVTVYRLCIDKKTFAPEDYPTQAAARAAGIKKLEENTRIQTIEVIPKIVREDGTALVKLTRNVKQATAKVKVSYAKMKTENPTVIGYMVAFDYHS